MFCITLNSILQIIQGRTKAKDGDPICIYFAKGSCSQGPSCSFLHRVPNADDERALSNTHDIFGRDRFAEDRQVCTNAMHNALHNIICILNTHLSNTKPGNYEDIHNNKNGCCILIALWLLQKRCLNCPKGASLSPR